MKLTIREELKRAFDEKGWTYKELGDRLGISDASAHRKLNGVHRIESGVELEAFARVLGLKVSVERCK